MQTTDVGITMHVRPLNATEPRALQIQTHTPACLHDS
jgi:hypothetical protein